MKPIRFTLLLCLGLIISFAHSARAEDSEKTVLTHDVKVMAAIAAVPATGSIASAYASQKQAAQTLQKILHRAPTTERGIPASRMASQSSVETAGEYRANLEYMKKLYPHQLEAFEKRLAEFNQYQKDAHILDSEPARDVLNPTLRRQHILSFSKAVGNRAMRIARNLEDLTPAEQKILINNAVKTGTLSQSEGAQILAGKMKGALTSISTTEISEGAEFAGNALKGGLELAGKVAGPAYIVYVAYESKKDGKSILSAPVLCAIFDYGTILATGGLPLCTVGKFYGKTLTLLSNSDKITNQSLDKFSKNAANEGSVLWNQAHQEEIDARSVRTRAQEQMAAAGYFDDTPSTSSKGR